jgi:hypothetical protein
MTKLLEQGIAAARALPAARQDMIGELLLALAGAEPHCRLTPAQVEDLRLAIAEADAGQLADAREVADAWKKFDL